MNPLIRRRPRAGHAAGETLLLVAVVAAAGLGGVTLVGRGAASAIFAAGPEQSAATPVIVSAQAGAVEGASRALSAAEHVALEASPLAGKLRLPRAAGWGDAVTYVMAKHAASRPLGEAVSYAFELFIGGATSHTRVSRIDPALFASLGLPERAATAARGPYLNGERFARLVHSNLFELFRQTGATIEEGTTKYGGPFQLRNGTLTLHTNHPLFEGRVFDFDFESDHVFPDPTDAAMEQVLLRFALHALQRTGAGPEAAYALSDWFAASERLRLSAERRILLESRIGETNRAIMAKVRDMDSARKHNEAYDNHQSWMRATYSDWDDIPTMVQPPSMDRLQADLDRAERHLAKQEVGLANLNTHIASLRLEEGAAQQRFDTLAGLNP